MMVFCTCCGLLIYLPENCLTNESAIIIAAIMMLSPIAFGLVFQAHASLTPEQKAEFDKFRSRMKINPGKS